MVILLFDVSRLCSRHTTNWSCCTWTNVLSFVTMLVKIELCVNHFMNFFNFLCYLQKNSVKCQVIYFISVFSSRTSILLLSHEWQWHPIRVYRNLIWMLCYNGLRPIVSALPLLICMYRKFIRFEMQLYNFNIHSNC